MADPASKARTRFVLLLIMALWLTGCASSQINASGNSTSFSLESADLLQNDFAFLTPSTITGQEEDRQSLALVFADTLKSQRPGLRLLTLPETLSAINSNGLADDYRQMLENYRYTSIFDRDILGKVGEVTGARYLLQVKLASFRQESRGRLSVFGLRLLQTKEGNVRVFMTVWDSRDGTIAWEGMEEVNYAYDTYREKPIYFGKTVAEAARELVARLPK